MTFEDRLLRNSMVRFILDVITISVNIYDWFSPAFSRITLSIGLSLTAFTWIFIIIAWSLDSWGLIIVPIITIFLSTIILRRSAW